MASSVAAPTTRSPTDTAPTVRSPRRRVARRLARDRLFLTGFAIIAGVSLLALLAPWLAPHDPAAVDAMNRLAAPSRVHPLGTDGLGRDVLSRLLYGARWSLGTAALATVAVMTVGVGLGALSGYLGGLFDAVTMRVVDVLLGFPNLVLALAIVGMIGPGIRNVVIGLVAVWWVDYARLVRGMALSLREREYVTAAVAMGAGHGHVLRRHVLPGVVPTAAVLASLEMGSLILAISGLSFLGLGVQPPTPEWGSMLNEGRRFLTRAPQLMIYPGLAISTVVLGFNLIGDGLRDAVDARLE